VDTWREEVGIDVAEGMVGVELTAVRLGARVTVDTRVGAGVAIPQAANIATIVIM
jgi:hypothetical protein